MKVLAACVELGGTAVRDWATLDLDNARTRPYCAATEAMAVKNNKTRKRYTRLAQRLAPGE